MRRAVNRNRHRGTPPSSALMRSAGRRLVPLSQSEGACHPTGIGHGETGIGGVDDTELPRAAARYIFCPRLRRHRLHCADAVRQVHCPSGLRLRPSRGRDRFRISLLGSVSDDGRSLAPPGDVAADLGWAACPSLSLLGIQAGRSRAPERLGAVAGQREARLWIGGRRFHRRGFGRGLGLAAESRCHRRRFVWRDYDHDRPVSRPPARPLGSTTRPGGGHRQVLATLASHRARSTNRHRRSANGHRRWSHPEGRPEGLLRELRFTLFPRAFTHFPATVESISNLLNQKVTPEAVGTLASEDGAIFLRENAWFQDLADNGYAIDVYQSRYFDVCRAAGPSIATCSTYNQADVRFFHDLDVAPVEKAKVLLDYILNVDFGPILFKVSYFHHALRLTLGGLGLSLPEWDFKAISPSPLAAMDLLSRLSGRIESLGGGEAIFAYVLLPHDPFVYDRACELKKDVSSWSVRKGALWRFGIANSPARRRPRYRAHLEQVPLHPRQAGGDPGQDAGA